MISLTGGFNQQYMGAEIKVAKEKFARDSMTMSDAVNLYAFAESLDLAADFFEMLDALNVSLDVQHFNEPIADSFELLDAVETNLGEA